MTLESRLLRKTPGQRHSIPFFSSCFVVGFGSSFTPASVSFTSGLDFGSTAGSGLEIGRSGFISTGWGLPTSGSCFSGSCLVVLGSRSGFFSSGFFSSVFSSSVFFSSGFFSSGFFSSGFGTLGSGFISSWIFGLAFSGFGTSAFDTSGSGLTFVSSGFAASSGT